MRSSCPARDISRRRTGASASGFELNDRTMKVPEFLERGAPFASTAWKGK